MNHPNWKTAPERATHYQPPRDDSGMYVPVYWRLEDGKPVEAWPVDKYGSFAHVVNPSYTNDMFALLIGRPAEPVSPSVDWSKAPEGATHYYHKLANPWLKDGDMPMHFGCGVWMKYGSVDAGKAHIADAVPRPALPTWDGQGLPPIGTVCEYSFDSRSWHECHVRYVLDNDPDPDADGWQAVVWCPHLKKEQVARVAPVGQFKFRPARTPEQIAAEEREARINDLANAIKKSGWETPEILAAYLESHGYRKQPTA